MQTILLLEYIVELVDENRLFETSCINVIFQDQIFCLLSYSFSDQTNSTANAEFQPSVTVIASLKLC